MRRIFLEIAYDGTNYCGWQRQNGQITVEGVLNEVLSELTKENVEVIGASRTDSGVHAMGNVAVFDTECKIPAGKFRYAVNAKLPEDIRIIESKEVAGDFHPRYTKASKIYEYKILNREVNLPVYRYYTHFVYNRLDIDMMKKAATYIVGEHDFNCFCAAGSQVKDTVRNVFSIDIEKDDNDIITIKIHGDGFLYNMVRIIAGTLIQVGKGQKKPEDLVSIIESKDRKNAGPTAPANGLVLKKIYYS